MYDSSDIISYKVKLLLKIKITYRIRLLEIKYMEIIYKDNYLLILSINYGQVSNF